MGNILDCDFIEENLADKLVENPNDLNTAKKIFSYSLKAKCTNEEYFTRAGEVLYDDKPNFKLALALAKKYQANSNYNKAKEYFEAAADLTSLPENKFEAFMGLAYNHYKSNKYLEARKLAYQALSINPSSTAPYNLIGNLYFTSYERCKESKSRVRDRLVYLAAYEMYKKAGNTAQMMAAKEQFPSKEEIFNEGLEKGSKMNIDCWINQSVVLDSRD